MTPGQRAYEAWKQAMNVRFPVLAEWLDLQPIDHEAWEAAAKSVAYDGKGEPSGHCSAIDWRGNHR